MTRFALIATCKFDDAEQRDKLLPVLLAHGARSLKEEPGKALEFMLLVSREDDTTVVGYEAFESEESWATHHEGPSVQRLRKEAAALGYDTRTRITAIKFNIAG